MKYRSRPIEIDAVQWLNTEESQAEIRTLVGDDVVFCNPDGLMAIELGGERLLARPGDWIVKDASDAVSVLRAATFDARYEAREVQAADG